MVFSSTVILHIHEVILKLWYMKLYFMYISSYPFFHLPSSTYYGSLWPPWTHREFSRIHWDPIISDQRPSQGFSRPSSFVAYFKRYTNHVMKRFHKSHNKLFGVFVLMLKKPYVNILLDPFVIWLKSGEPSKFQAFKPNQAKVVRRFHKVRPTH